MSRQYTADMLLFALHPIFYLFANCLQAERSFSWQRVEAETLLHIDVAVQHDVTA